MVYRCTEKCPIESILRCCFSNKSNEISAKKCVVDAKSLFQMFTNNKLHFLILNGRNDSIIIVAVGYPVGNTIIDMKAVLVL